MTPDLRGIQDIYESPIPNKIDIESFPEIPIAPTEPVSSPVEEVELSDSESSGSESDSESGSESESASNSESDSDNSG